jgi:protein polybromo-1
VSLHYELISCPVDCRSVERMLRRPADRSYASPWFFACALELMLTNAQVYNDEDSQLHEEAGPSPAPPPRG